MQITLAHIGTRNAGGVKPRPGGRPAGKAASRDSIDAAVLIYLERSSAYARCQTEVFRSEEAFLDWVEKQNGRTAALAVLLDSRGKLMSSEAFAAVARGPAG